MAEDKGSTQPGSESDDKRLSELYTDDEIRGIFESASTDINPFFEFEDLEEGIGETREETSSVSSTQDPETAYDLFYRKKQRLLDQILPGTRDTSEANRLIRDEITLFLSEGHEVERDSRQSYTHKKEEAVAMLMSFINSGGSDLYRLYVTFCDENRKRGYR